MRWHTIPKIGQTIWAQVKIALFAAMALQAVGVSELIGTTTTTAGLLAAVAIPSVAHTDVNLHEARSR